MEILTPEKIKIKNQGFFRNPLEQPHPIFGATETVEEHVALAIGDVPAILYPNNDARSACEDITDLQRNSIFDPYDCVTCAHLNLTYCLCRAALGITLEIKSRRFTAVDSGTIPGQGNSNYNVQQSVITTGLIPESVYPSMSPTMTQGEFYQGIPASVKAAENFKNIYGIQFFLAPTTDGIRATNITLFDLLLYSPIVVTVDGNYGFDANGCVISQNIQANGLRSTASDSHDVLLVRCPTPTENYYIVLDSENPQGFVKFSSTYDFHYPTWGFINQVNMPKIYKKKAGAAIYALNSEAGVLVPFGDGVISGGTLFKTLYGINDYSMLPRVKDAQGNDWDILPYPVAPYSFITK